MASPHPFLPLPDQYADKWHESFRQLGCCKYWEYSKGQERVLRDVKWAKILMSAWISRIYLNYLYDNKIGLNVFAWDYLAQ